jgi:hypothetical protein
MRTLFLVSSLLYCGLATAKGHEKGHEKGHDNGQGEGHENGHHDEYGHGNGHGHGHGHGHDCEPDGESECDINLEETTHKLEAAFAEVDAAYDALEAAHLELADARAELDAIYDTGVVDPNLGTSLPALDGIVYGPTYVESESASAYFVVIPQEQLVDLTVKEVSDLGLVVMPEGELFDIVDAIVREYEAAGLTVLTEDLVDLTVKEIKEL